MTEQYDLINHPPHYVGFSNGSEVIDITEQMSFNLGNAVKYLARAGRKTENPLEDLRKAAWYIEREIGRLGLTETGDPVEPAPALEPEPESESGTPKADAAIQAEDIEDTSQTDCAFCEGCPKCEDTTPKSQQDLWNTLNITVVALDVLGDVVKGLNQRQFNLEARMSTTDTRLAALESAQDNEYEERYQ